MKINKILIPISNPEYLEEMVRISCNIASLYKAKILALYVIEIPRSLPLDAEIKEEQDKGEEILKKAYDFASSEYGIEIDTDILQARTAGPAILEEVIENGIDLILLEAEAKKSLEEKIFGSTVDYILKNAPCHVWIIRPFLKEKT